MDPTDALRNLPIGVFDSGLGGLTVLKSLELHLPHESFLYFGDTAHVPYGTRSDETVIRYSESITRFLLSQPVKLIIIACNTASAVALHYLRERFTVPIIGVVEPMVKKTLAMSSTGRIGIIGTRATIQSGAYSKRFLSTGKNLTLTEKACPLFVPLIEEGWAETDIARQVAQIYLEGIMQTRPDTLVLGCTHYPMIAVTLKKILPPGVNLISSGEAVADETADFLKKHQLHTNTPSRRMERFFVTDYPQQFDRIGSRFLGRKLTNVERVDIL